jgi:glutamate synthase (NADH)
MAEEIRRIMAQLGFRTFQELVGRTDKLRFNPSARIGKAQLLNFDSMLKNALELRPGANIRAGTVAQDYRMEERLVMSNAAVLCKILPVFVMYLSVERCWRL